MMWQRAGGVLALAAAVGCSAGPTPTPSGPVQPGAVKSIPVELQDVKAPALDLAVRDAKGKVVLVDFWAFWCGPCVKKFPHLVELHQKHAGQGLVVMSVCMEAMDGDPVTAQKKDKILAFLKDKGAAFPNFVVTDHKAAADGLKATFGFGMDSLPYMAVFSRTGERVWDSDSHLLKADKFPTDADVDEVVGRELAK